MKNTIKTKQELVKFRTVMRCIYISIAILGMAVLAGSVGGLENNPYYTMSEFIIEFILAAMFIFIAFYVRAWTVKVFKKNLLYIKVRERYERHNKAVV